MININLITEIVEGLAIVYFANQNKIKSWFSKEEQQVVHEAAVVKQVITKVEANVEEMIASAEEDVKAAETAVKPVIADIANIGQAYTDASGKAQRK